MTPDPAALTRGATVAPATGWRGALRRELALLFALKVAALALLWWLFFSPEHRTPVDAVATGQRLGVGPGDAYRAGQSPEGARP